MLDWNRHTVSFPDPNLVLGQLNGTFLRVSHEAEGKTTAAMVLCLQNLQFFLEDVIVKRAETPEIQTVAEKQRDETSEVQGITENFEDKPEISSRAYKRPETPEVQTVAAKQHGEMLEVRALLESFENEPEDSYGVYEVSETHEEEKEKRRIANLDDKEEELPRRTIVDFERTEAIYAAITRSIGVAEGKKDYLYGFYSKSSRGRKKGQPFPQESMGIENYSESAIADMYALCVTSAMKRCNMETGQCSEAVFSGKEAVDIYLREEHACFNVNIHINNWLKAASLRLGRDSIEIVANGRLLTHEPFSAFLIRALKKDPPRFILELSNGSEIVCSPEGSSLYEAVVTLKAYQFKAYILDGWDSMLAERYSVWPKPSKHNVKLSTAYTYCHKIIEDYEFMPESAAVGGLIRDDTGKWLSGFWKQVAVASKIQLQLLALKIGLQLARDKSREGVFDCFIDVESPSDAVSYLISHGTKEPSVCHLVADCQHLLVEIFDCRLVRIDQEFNLAAFLLAEEGHKMCMGVLNVSDVEPVQIDGLSEVLLIDSSGITPPVAERMSKISNKIDEEVKENETDKVKEEAAKERMSKGEKKARRKTLSKVKKNDPIKVESPKLPKFPWWGLQLS